VGGQIISVETVAALVIAADVSSLGVVVEPAPGGKRPRAASAAYACRWVRVLEPQCGKRDKEGQKNSVTATLTGVKESDLYRSRWMEDTIGFYGFRVTSAAGSFLG
jgi:hypothetical protein